MVPEPNFAEPWHAQIFALTVHLNESGVFAWNDWAQTFGATLKSHGLSRELNGGSDYFDAWLEALETLLTTKGLADAKQLGVLRDAWTSAYLSTPHGMPVTI